MSTTGYVSYTEKFICKTSFLQKIMKPPQIQARLNFPSQPMKSSIFFYYYYDYCQLNYMHGRDHTARLHLSAIFFDLTFLLSFFFFPVLFASVEASFRCLLWLSLLPPNLRPSLELYPVHPLPPYLLYSSQIYCLLCL